MPTARDRCERFLSANPRNGRQPFLLTTVGRTNQQQGQKISTSCNITTTSTTNQNLSATSDANTTKNRRRQKPAKKISWTVLLNKMYEQALVKQQNFGGNEDRCVTGIENGHRGDDGTKTVVVTCTPNLYSPVKDGSGATVFVTTSSQTNTTTTVTSCGSVIKTTSQQMSAKVVKVKNSNLTATAPVNAASSCKDLLKFLPDKNGRPFLDRTGRGSRSSSSIIIPTPNGVAPEVTGHCAPDGQIIIISSPVSPEKVKNFVGGSFFASNDERKNAEQKEEELIDETLNKTLVTFGSLLQKEKEKFMDMFPQFINERTKPRITTETIVQPDGTILVIEKEESRHVLQLSRRTTFINGKIHLRTTKAVMVYGGAENGYELKLEEADDDEPAVQESENEDNDEESDLWSNSEFGDSESVQFHLEKPAAINNRRFLLTAENETKKCKKKLDNAFSAAQELVETERRYISKLHLLNKTFRQKVEELNDKSILGDKICKLFSNVATLFIFHNDHLLPQLENRLKEWNQSQRISDVICKLAPYLKMYSEYTNNYNKACKVFDELRRKNKRFAHIVTEVELLPECENLPLQSHLICPVQRVARYHLLLKEYHKNLPDNHPDQRDAESALEKVKVAASHANDMMKKLDKYRDVIEIQEQLGNQLQGLVTPCRELIKKGRLTKISGRSGDKQDRMLFLFNDLLLLCSDRSVPFSKYKLRTVFQLDELTLLEGDDLEQEYSFHLRSKTKRVELGAKNSSEKSEWLETLWSCIKSYRIQKDSFNTLPSPTNSLGPDVSDSCDSPSGVKKCCSKCKSSFRFLNREVSCTVCELPMCKKCAKKSPCDNLISSDNKSKQIVCLDCAENAYLNRRTITQPQNDERKELKFSEPVKPTDDCVLNGYLDFRNAKTSQWSTRYFALRADYVLYCFRDIKDDNARSSLILPGCEVALIDPKTDASVFSRQANNLIFKLIRPNVTYYLRANNENDSAQWMAALDLASQADLTTKLITVNDDKQEQI